MVTFPANGASATGYVCTPPDGTGPGLLVLQEWWGLVDHIKQVTDRFAEAGFVAMAVDLYHGEQAETPDDARRLLMALDIDKTAQALRGAAQYLLKHPAVTPEKVGALGFCMGGQLALYAATAHPDVISAVVDFYGIFNPRVPVDLTTLRAPVQLHFGDHDRSISREQADGLIAGIAATGVAHEPYFYDAGHAFFNDTKPAYSEESAELAWTRSVEFLHRTLG
jgi:carboxymethylenebutenolidase